MLTLVRDSFGSGRVVPSNRYCECSWMINNPQDGFGDAVELGYSDVSNVDARRKVIRT